LGSWDFVCVGLVDIALWLLYIIVVNASTKLDVSSLWPNVKLTFGVCGNTTTTSASMATIVAYVQLGAKL
jgi:hypothetical protein